MKKITSVLYVFVMLVIKVPKEQSIEFIVVSPILVNKWNFLSDSCDFLHTALNSKSPDMLAFEGALGRW